MKRNFRNLPQENSAKRSLLVIAASVTFFISIGNVFGDIYVTASESEGHTTIEWSGNLDVSKLSYAGVVDAPTSSIFPKLGLLSGSKDKKLDGYLLSSVSPRTFGNGAATLPISTSGDSLLITNTVSGNEVCLCLPAGYKGGTLRGKITFHASLAKLGVATDPFFYDLGGQSIYFFPTADSFTHSANTPIKKVLSRVLPSRERKVLKIRAFVEVSKSEETDSEVASVEVRPVSVSAR